MIFRMFVYFACIAGGMSLLAHLILRTKYFKAKRVLSITKAMGILFIGIVSAIIVLALAVNLKL